MASAAVAIRPSVTALEPFRHIPGTPARQAVELANAHHEGRFKKLMEQAQALQRNLSTHVSKTGAARQTAGAALLNAGVTGVAAVTLGVVDKRYGAERGHAQIAGFPVDALIAGLGHAAAVGTMFLTDMPILTNVLHAVGNGGLGALAHRVGGEVGSAWLERSQQQAAGVPMAAAVAPNGARPGAVYTVAAPHAKAG